MQTAKNLIKKAWDSNQDFQKALLVYRSTPLSCGKSPAQLLMGRNLRSNLPVAAAELKHSGNHNSRNFMAEKKRQKQDFNKRVKPLSELQPDTRVYIYDKRKKVWSTTGKVVKKVAQRSYLIKSDRGGTYRRNRVHLRPVGQGTRYRNKWASRRYDDDDWEQGGLPNIVTTQNNETAGNSIHSYSLRPRRNIRAPQRLITSM